MINENLEVATYGTQNGIIEVNIPSSIQEMSNNLYTVYPNPANTHITINNGNFGIYAGYELRITDSLGQVVYDAEITQQDVTLDISTWGQNGLYILYIQEPNGNTFAVKQIVLK